MAFGTNAVAATNGVTHTFECAEPGKKARFSDRPFTDCKSDETEIAPSGAVAPVPPALSAAEKAAKDEKDRKDRLAHDADKQRLLAEADLLRRYPDEPSVRRAHEAEVGPLRENVRLAEMRLAELRAARKPLEDEAEFYSGKPKPSKLKASLDANDALLSAERQILRERQDAVAESGQSFEARLAQLRRLWKR